MKDIYPYLLNGLCIIIFISEKRFMLHIGIAAATVDNTVIEAIK